MKYIFYRKPGTSRVHKLFELGLYDFWSFSIFTKCAFLFGTKKPVVSNFSVGTLYKDIVVDFNISDRLLPQWRRSFRKTEDVEVLAHSWKTFIVSDWRWWTILIERLSDLRGSIMT